MENELSEKFSAYFFKVKVSKVGNVTVHRFVEERGEEWG